MASIETRIAALAAEIGEDVDSIEEGGYTEMLFTAPGAEYLVLAEEEAAAAAAEYVEQSVWAFNADFLEEMTDVPAVMFAALQDQCEGANDAFLTVIRGTCGLDEFAAAAIDADGRGHLLNNYDGKEIEVTADDEDATRLYTYRTN